MLAEEFIVLDSDSPLWMSTSPLLDIALLFDQNDETYSWNGWNKRQISDFLKSLPSRSSLVVGVWETIPEKEGSPECENLALGLICEIIDGEVCFKVEYGRKNLVNLESNITTVPGKCAASHESS